MAMAKENGKEKKSTGGNPKPKSAVETIAGLIASGALGEEVTQKAKDALRGDSSFFSWWQRQAEESIFSTNNVLKALGLIGGYAVYDHVDPMEGSKVDDAMILVAAIVLGSLLIIPQSNELGTHFHDFETDVFLAVKDLTNEEKEKILTWMRDLSNKQEGRIAAMFKKIAAKDKDALTAILADEKMRNLLCELVGEDQKPMSFDEGIAKAKEVLEKHWPTVKEKYQEADRALAEKLRGFRAFLNAKGVRR